jgi:hypothetical protein
MDESKTCASARRKGPIRPAAEALHRETVDFTRPIAARKRKPESRYSLDLDVTGVANLTGECLKKRQEHLQSARIQEHRRRNRRIGCARSRNAVNRPGAFFREPWTSPA